MKEQNSKCLVGRDSDDVASGLAGILIVVAIAIIVLIVIVMVVLYAGAFIGGFHSLKNYAISLKHNVYDSNRKPVSVA